jgi:hypothetical protein
MDVIQFMNCEKGVALDNIGYKTLLFRMLFYPKPS